jgi:sugar lactone lactonase YvrE
MSHERLNALARTIIDSNRYLSNRRVWADGVGPDGICLDADGCIWTSSANMANEPAPGVGP